MHSHPMLLGRKFAYKFCLTEKTDVFIMEKIVFLQNDDRQR